MKPSELTADQVRKELESLIERFPGKTGSFDQTKIYYDSDEEYDDSICVYYLDQNGFPITSNTHDPNGDMIVFTQPVCIVGQWVEEFHPNFKEDEVIRQTLFRNSTIKAMEYDEEIPWDADVQRLLVIAQDSQDRGTGTWANIDLDSDSTYL